MNFTRPKPSKPPVLTDEVPVAESTIDREREFHDARFHAGADTRDKLAAVYTIISASKQAARDIIRNAGRPGGHLLEYGSGDGIDLPFYRKLGCHLHGIDISKEAIGKASAAARAAGVVVRYSVGDCHTTLLPDDKFDCVAGNGILHHLTLHKALAELARITREDGTCVFTEPLGHNPLINLFRWLTPSLRSPDEHPILMHDLGLMQSYFGRVEVTHYYLFALLAVPFRRMRCFDRVYQALLRFDERVFRWFPILRRHSWMCLIVLSSPKKADFRWRELVRTGGAACTTK